ncbi:hypothetical protein ABC974_25040 [Sphingomonas oligophenolica]|uniref:Uncharacterized protein n=1 Tax=Sphingomonas oligophenolica TaxID=301154 RepID=A0ABU9YAT3_9SPHN
MNVVERIKCLWGYHRRDGRRIHYSGTFDSPICAGCERQMVRELRQWRIAKPDERHDEGA